MPFWAALILGLAVGGLSGLLGIGGGVVLIPALVYLAGFSQKESVGTTLAVLVPPIGIFAATQYYREGYVRLWPAIWIALGFALGSWLTASQIKRIPGEWLSRAFGVLLLFLGTRMIIFSDRRAAVMADALATWLIELGAWLGMLGFSFGVLIVLRKKGTAYHVRPDFAAAVIKAEAHADNIDFQI